LEWQCVALSLWQGLEIPSLTLPPNPQESADARRAAEEEATAALLAREAAGGRRRSTRVVCRKAQPVDSYLKGLFERFPPVADVKVRSFAATGRDCASRGNARNRRAGFSLRD
jgi:hypothetical protein